MQFFTLFFLAGRLWFKKEADQYAAALAYFVPFALTPLLLISMTWVGLIVGRDRLIELLTRWGMLVDPELPEIMTNALIQLESQSDNFYIPIVAVAFFSIMILVALNSLTAGIHKLWGLENFGFRVLISRYLRAILAIALIQCYIVSIIIISGAVTWIGNIVPLLSLAFVQKGSFLIVTVFYVTIMYRMLPVSTLPLKSCFYGGLVSGILFLGLQAFVTSHIVTAPAVTLYGAASIIVLLLIWFYAIGSVIFYGAAFAKVHYDNFSKN